MILVGVSGTIGSGKTTFANYLALHEPQHNHWESGQLIAAVANALREHEMPLSHPRDLRSLNQWLEPLPELLRQTLHTTVDSDIAVITEQKITEHPELYDKLFEYTMLICDNPQLQYNTISDANKEELRSLLQWLGGFIAKTVGGEVWYSEIVRRIHATPDIALATVGGVRFPGDAAVLRADGGKVITLNRSALLSPNGTDVTEREICMVVPDTIVHNDGTLEQLEACAGQVYKDLSEAVLAKVYRASNYGT